VVQGDNMSVTERPDEWKMKNKKLILKKNYKYYTNHKLFKMYLCLKIPKNNIMQKLIKIQIYVPPQKKYWYIKKCEKLTRYTFTFDLNKLF